ncbi:MAG TPA: hypothetical protein VLA77_02435 [Candidatus Saccharimonadales bacterium]|nr:hypothetical protein [Candidatus Saccharimonadales bacterium]
MQTTANRYIRRTLIVLFLSLGLLGFGLVMAEQVIQSKFSEVQHEMGRLQDEVLKPAGAIYTGREVIQGVHVGQPLFCIDITCPSYDQEWYVPLEPKDGAAFLLNTLNTLGYRMAPGDSPEDVERCTARRLGICPVFAFRDGLMMRLVLDYQDMAQDPSYPDIGTKEWVSLGVNVAPAPN